MTSVSFPLAAPDLTLVTVPTVEVRLSDGVCVPGGISDLAGFHAWMRSDDFPTEGRISYLAGTIWVDLSMEQAYSHNQVKTALTAALVPLARALGTGRFYTDGMRLGNAAADLSTDPDGMFVSFEAFESGRVKEFAAGAEGVTAFEGSPDMVLEVASDSSVDKDYDLLPDLYCQAGVPEYWRVDARGTLTFEILHRTDNGYVSAVDPDGWCRSKVFGRSFRLIQSADRLGRPDYTLESRE
jgi:Uma2 family endonuclease